MLKLYFIVLFFVISITTKADNSLKTCNISLAEWSLHRNLFDSVINHLDFPRIAVDSSDIYTLEYVSAFFQDKAENKDYLQQMKDSCTKYNVRSLLIMVDNEGNLGDTCETARHQSVQKHIKWINAAHFLGCTSIRVNGNGLGDADDVQKALIKSLRELSEIGAGFNINILVENHGMSKPGIPWDTDTYSANPIWLSETLKLTDMDNCGALPDFGNFHTHNPYMGVSMLMPYAKGISAKTFAFDSAGNETTIDYSKMFEIINSFDFNGYIGIEYEGNNFSISEFEGIRKTKELILKYCK